MPLFDYGCSSCGHVHEAYIKVRPAPGVVTCPNCGEGAKRKVSMPAKTASAWGDSAGYYDRGLGTYIQNDQHRRQVMAAQGVREVGDDELDRVIDARME